MRIRRRYSRGRSRRVTGKGDWVLGLKTNCPVNTAYTDATQCDFEGSPPNPTAFSLIDSDDISEKQDSLTCVRIVGELNHVQSMVIPGADLSPWSLQLIVAEGIYVSTTDGAGPPSDVIDLDPALSGDLELDQWLWLRKMPFTFMGFGGTGSTAHLWQGNGDYSGALNPHIDIRVKRKLKRGQELIYAVSYRFHASNLIVNTNTFATGTLNGQLRCYVKF